MSSWIHSKKRTRERIAWVAGLLEGEGTFQFYDRKVKTEGKEYPCRGLTISCTMTDKDVLVRLQRWSGCGLIYATRKHEKFDRVKPQFMWTAQGSKEAYALMIAIFPFMGKRRQAKIKEVLTSWLAVPPRPKKGSLTECVNGHEYTNDNTYVSPRGEKSCRACRRASSKRGRSS